MKKDKGLTLIELAIVLIVLGILLGIGAGIIGVLIKRVKYNESKEIVNAAVEGIIGYATTNGRLPATDNEVRSAIKSATDAYGKRLLYIYSDNLDDTPNSVCLSTGTNLILRVGCSDANCTTYNHEIENIAFVVVSGDGNYNIQTGRVDGTNLVSVSSSTVYIYKTDPALTNVTRVGAYEYGVNNVDKFTNDLNRQEFYDDIVSLVSLNELKSKVGCPNYTVSIATSALPTATEDRFYEFFLQASGGANNKWGTVSGSGCDISYSTQAFGTGNWLTLERDTGRLYGTANEDTSSPWGILSSCTATVNLNNLCVCADVNNNNQCDAGEPFDQRDLSITIVPQEVKIVTNSLPTAREDRTSTYHVVIKAIGGSGTYTFALSPWGDIDNDDNPDYDHNNDGSPDLEACLDTNDDGNPDCSTPVSGNSALALVISGILPNNDPGTCQGETINFSVQASSCSTSHTKGFSITVEDPDCLRGGTCSYGSPITVNNVGGSRTAWLGSIILTFCSLTGSCQDFTSISVGSSNCLRVYTGERCNSSEQTYGYDDLYNVDANRDCVVNYRNGNLEDN